MDKLYELLLEKIDKKLSTRAFFCTGGILAVAGLDYSRKILLVSLDTIKFFLISIIVIWIIYLFIVKKSVKEFIYNAESREYSDDNYIIDCVKYEITIFHMKRRILWGGKPEIKFEIRNKTNEIIENLEGYIDLFFGGTCIIHKKIKIDYILPNLSKEEVLVDNELAYRSWETAKFVLVENGLVVDFFRGISRYKIIDIEYPLIKNKTIYVLKEKLKEFKNKVNWYWNSKVFYRILIIAIGVTIAVLILLWMYVLTNEIYRWIILHINTYLN